MRLYKFLHSCLMVEEGNTRILFDPGNFSFIENKVAPDDFRNISLIVFTHEHGDHLDIPALKIILQNNEAAILTNSGVKARLEKEGLPATALDSGEYRIGNCAIKVFPAEHGQLLAPVPSNTAYLINDAFLNTGDSLDKNLLQLKNIKVLALSILGPWMKATEAGEFVKALSPQIVLPVHDGFVKSFFLERQYENWQKFLSPVNIEWRPLNNTLEFIEINSES